MSHRISKAVLIAGTMITLTTAGPLVADDEWGISGHVELVTDYRLRGVSLTNKNPTVQGGIDISRGGFFGGVWASGLDETFAGANTEIDFYGGYSFALTEGVTFDIGGTYYGYSGGSDLDFVEAFATLGFATGDIGWAATAYYAPDQKNMADQDNLYLHLSADYAVPNSPWSFGATLGYEDGFFADALAGGTKWDYGASITYSFEKISLTVSGINTDRSSAETDAAVLVTLGAAF